MEGIILNELFNVVKDFTQRSNCWREAVEFQVSPCSGTTYELETATQAYINRLIWIEGGRQCGTCADSYQPGPLMAGSLVETGAQRAVLILPATPSVLQNWHAHVALTVCDPTDREALPHFPDWLLEKYQKYIVSGVISVMAAHAAKPYSNLKLAGVHGRLFRTGINLAKAEAEHGYVHRGQRWGFPQNFRAKTQRNSGWR
jgi:hypothetical protein